MKLMGRDSIAIVPTAPVRLRNNDVEYAYRPDSDFFYLTGFNEPESVAVLVPGRPQGEYILFVRDRDPARETWDGRRAGPDGVVRDFGAADGFPIADIDEILPGLMENRAKVFYAMGTHPEFDQRVVGWVNGLRTQARNGRHPPLEMVALDHVLHDMRLFKSRTEVDTMRTAARIAAQAHVRAMRACSPGKREYEIAAEVVHEFRRYNADLSYLPIVGGGANGCILHYRENDSVLADGDLLLIDAGCEVDCYASDITRTFPVNGRFSAEQRALYDIVLEANYAAIERVKPGNHWNQPHEAAVRVITQGLVKVGLLKGKVAKLEESGAYRKFFMHRTGHWLGMDVHDVGDYQKPLAAGMTFVIEPGIYVRPQALEALADTPEDRKFKDAVAKAVEKYKGMGVRVEDSFLLTATGLTSLSATTPRTIEQIEAHMREKPRSAPTAQR